MGGKIPILFITFQLISSVEVDLTTTLVDLNETEDGQQFIKELIDGKRVSDRPKQLIFTAPFKLCDKEQTCKSNNFAMVFPLYVGNRAGDKYKQFYSKDYNTIFDAKSNAPFKRKTTRHSYTPCLIRYEVTSITSSPEISTLTQPQKIRGEPVKDSEKLHENESFKIRNPTVPICCPKFNPYWYHCE